MGNDYAIDAARVVMRLELTTLKSTPSYFDIPFCVALRCVPFLVLGFILSCVRFFYRPEEVWATITVHILQITLLLPYLYFTLCGITLVHTAKKIARGDILHWFAKWWTNGIEFLVRHRIDFRGVTHMCALCGLGIALCIHEDMGSVLVGFCGGSFIGEFVAIFYLRTFRLLSKRMQALFALATVGITDEKLKELGGYELQYIEHHYKS